MAVAAPRKGDMLASPAAERALLGCVLVDEFEVWGELVEVPLCAEDFAYPENQSLWRAFRWLYEQGMEITATATVYALERIGLLDAVDRWLGAPAVAVEQYLFELLQECFSAKGCMAFARIVKHYSDMRAPLSRRSGLEMAL